MLVNINSSLEGRAGTEELSKFTRVGLDASYVFSVDCPIASLTACLILMPIFIFLVFLYMVG